MTTGSSAQPSMSTTGEAGNLNTVLDAIQTDASAPVTLGGRW